MVTLVFMNSPGIPGPTRRLDRDGITRIEVGGPPQPIVAGQGAAWVHVGSRDGSEQLWRVDARTGEAVGVPGLIGIEWPAAGPEGVWVGVCPQGSGDLCPGGKIVRIEPVSLQALEEISSEQPFQIATADGYVWANVADEAGGMRLLKIDAATNRVVGRFACCEGVLAAGEGAVWVAQIDPATGEPTERAGLHDPERDRLNACRLAAGEGAVWVTTCDGQADVLLRVDPETLKVTGRIRFDGLPRLAVGEGWVWVVEQPVHGPGNTLTLFRIDPQTLQRYEPVELSSGKPPEFSFYGPGPAPLFLDAGEGAVWVSDFVDGEVIRIVAP